MEKILIFIVLFLSFAPSTFADYFTIENKYKTEIMSTGTGGVSNDKIVEQLNNLSDIQNQQLYLQIMNTFFFLFFILYTLTNDLLGKR